MTFSCEVYHFFVGFTLVAGLDIQDNNGRHEVGFIENTAKIPINGGNGCRLETQFNLNKVPGNFHVSTHSAKNQPDTADMAHVIHTLRFGEQIHHVNIPGSFETLNQKDNTDSDGKNLPFL